MASLDDVVKNATAKSNSEVYVFFDAPAARTFYNDSDIQNNEGGITFKLHSSDPKATLFISPYQRGNIGGTFSVTYTDDEYTEISAHEIGHAIDFSLNDPSLSFDFAKFVLRDFAELDFANIDPTSKSNSIPRLPCGPTPDSQGGFFSDPPPFAGVDVVNSAVPFPVCIGTSLNPIFANMTNSQIFIQNEVLWDPGVQDLWREGHPQGIAYGLTGNLGARPFNDGVFDNMRFNCVKVWANQNLTTGSNPSAAECDAPPAWYALPN